MTREAPVCHNWENPVQQQRPSAAKDIHTDYQFLLSILKKIFFCIWICELLLNFTTFSKWSLNHKTKTFRLFNVSLEWYGKKKITKHHPFRKRLGVHKWSRESRLGVVVPLLPTLLKWPFLGQQTVWLGRHPSSLLTQRRPSKSTQVPILEHLFICNRGSIYKMLIYRLVMMPVSFFEMVMVV